MQHKSLGFMQLAIICGFSFYYAWYLISFFALFVSPPAIATFVEVHVGQVVFFGSSVLTTLVTLALFHRSNSSIVGHAKLLILATLAFGLALPVLVIAGNLISFASLPLFYGACMLSGASTAVGFMLWENLSTQGYLDKGVLAHGTIFCAGGIVFLCSMLFLSNLEMSLLAALLLIASTALLAFITPRCDTVENKPIEPVRDYFRKVWNIDVVVVVLNISFGYAFILLFGYDKTLLVATMAAAVAADLIFSIIFGRGKWLLFAGSVRVCVAFASCALILLVLPGTATSLGALCILFGFWFIFRTINGRIAYRFGECSQLPGSLFVDAGEAVRQRGFCHRPWLGCRCGRCSSTRNHYDLHSTRPRRSIYLHSPVPSALRRGIGHSGLQNAGACRYARAI